MTDTVSIGSMPSLVRVFDSLPGESVPPLAEFGNPVSGSFFGGFVAAGSSGMPDGWERIFVTYSILAADSPDEFYISTYFRDASGNDLAPEQAGNPRTASLSVPLTEEQTYLDASDRAIVDHVEITSRPTGSGSQGPGVTYNWTPRFSATFESSGTPPPEGEWWDIVYDDSAWQLPASSMGAEAPTPLPGSEFITHLDAMTPNAIVGERVFYRQAFTLPNAEYVSAQFEAYVEDTTPVGVYINEHQVTDSIKTVDPGSGYNTIDVEVPVEWLIVGGGTNMIATCVENASGTDLNISYRLLIEVAVEVGVGRLATIVG